jgi:hypothetical protein
VLDNAIPPEVLSRKLSHAHQNLTHIHSTLDTFITTTSHFPHSRHAHHTMFPIVPNSLLPIIPNSFLYYIYSAEQIADHNRRIATGRRQASGSARSSRAGTPTATGPQSMGSFLPQTQSGGSGGDAGFNFTASAPTNNPFAQQNGTPEPTFAFGQQNGGSAFGSNNNTGSSFGGTFSGSNNNASQTPQQNGFNPPSTSGGLFSTQNNTNNTSSFGGFGQANQTTQPQQNGVTPSTATTASFPSFGKQNGDTSFKGFQSLQTPQQTQSTPGTSFGGFNSLQPNGDKAPATPSFGGFGSQKPSEKSSLFASTAETPKPSTSLFTADTPKSSNSLFSGGSFGQPNGTSKPEETPKANATSLFSNLQQSGSATGLFGAPTSLPEQRPTTPGGSVLPGLDANRAKTVTHGMFTQNKTSETPKTNMFSFNQQGSDGTPGAEETPKASSNLFSAAKTNGVTSNSNLFNGATNTEQQTSAKQTSNLFSGAFGQPPQQTSSTPGFTFGQSTQSLQDTSMHTPGSTPQKSGSNPFDQSQSHTAANEQTGHTLPPSETPVGQGKSLFDRITPRDEPPATAQKPSFTPSASMFSGANNKENETTSGGNLFQRAPSNEQPSSLQQQTSFTPSTSLYSKPASQASQTPSAAPWLSHVTGTPAAPITKVTPATPQPPVTAQRAATSPVSMSEPISESEKETFKVLNEGLLKHLSTQDPNADWTTIMQYYLQQAAKIRSKPEPKFDAPVAPQTAPRPTSSSGLLREKSLTEQQYAGLSQTAKPSTPSTSNNMFQPASTPSNSNNLFSSASTPKPSASNTSNLFQAAQTPRQPTLNSQTSRPPATAPVNRKRPGPFTEEDDDEDADRFPATEKRARHDEPLSYPKLPQGASETAKLFQAALDKPADKAKEGDAQQPAPTSSIGGFKPLSISSLGGFKPSSTSSIGGFQPSASTSSEQPGASNSSIGAFKPTASTTTTGGFKPSESTSTTGGFKPTTASSTGLTPANGGPPTVSPTTLKSGGFLSAFGKKANAEEEKEKKKRKLDDYDSDEETEEEWAQRDEEEQKAKRQKIAEESKKASGFVFNATAAIKAGEAVNVFGHLSQSASEASDNETDDGNADDKAEPEKAQGPGDNTWNMKTPIKFGASTSGNESTTPAAAPPAFNLFGTTPATSSTGFLNVPSTTKPSIGFNFLSNAGSSAGTSRASTPGITTDGEGSTAGDGDDETQPSEPQVEDQTGLRPEETEHEDVVFSCPSATAKKVKTRKDENAPTGQSKGWVTVAIGPLYVLKNKDTGRARILLKVPPYGNAKMNFPLIAKMNYVVAGKKENMVQGAFVDHIDEKPPKVAAYLLEVGAEVAPGLAKALMESRPE